MILAAAMDGNVYLFQGLGNQMRKLTKIRSHTSWVKDCSWNVFKQSALEYASVSRDQHCVLQRVTRQEGDTAIVEKCQALFFGESVESCAFIGTDRLAVSTAGHLGITICDMEKNTKAAFDFTTRSRSGDASICMVRRSPCGGFLLAASNIGKIYLLGSLSSSEPQIVRIFGGHSSGQFSTPAIAWSLESDFIFSNSQHDASLYSWQVASGKIEGRYEGHSKAIRNLCSRGNES